MAQEPVSGDPQDPTEAAKDATDIAVDTSGSGGRSSSISLSDKARQNLIRLLRLAYPHPSFPDGPYERTAKQVEEACYADAEAAKLLQEGLESLDEDRDFLGLDEKAGAERLKQVGDSPFFKTIHATTVVGLYDDHEVWELLGYEGASFDKGGYLHRGFDDLDWLPEPRITEYEGEPRVEIVTDGEAAK